MGRKSPQNSLFLPRSKDGRVSHMTGSLLARKESEHRCMNNFPYQISILPTPNSLSCLSCSIYLSLPLIVIASSTSISIYSQALALLKVVDFISAFDYKGETEAIIALSVDGANRKASTLQVAY
jgi:hypothetical protein